MFVELLIYIIYTLFCLFAVLGYGIIFKTLIFNPSKNNLAELGLYGFLILFFISLFSHFFTPLTYWFNFIILVLGFIVSCLNFNYIKNEISELKKYFILITLIILPSILIHNTYADYEWYHLPYVNYLNHFKVVFGEIYG